MEEYVDVFSDKYTKWWKRFAIFKLIAKLSIVALLCFGIVVVGQGMVPYIKGTEEWEAAPFTLSQINALLCFFTFAYLSLKAMKVYGKW